MAYPPAVLPINMTDATPQQTTHPDLHNKVGAAINDTVAKLGTDPAGGEATTTVKLQAIDNAIVNLGNNTAAAIAAMKNPNWVDAVDHTNGNTGFAIAAQSSVVTTNGNGDFSINFLPMFTAPPIVVCSPDTTTGVNLVISINSRATSNFTAHAIYSNTDAATPAANVTIRVNWIAVGQK